MAKKPSGESVAIEIIRPVERVVQFLVIGDAILVTHNWSEKAKAMLRQAGTKSVRTKREARTPEKDYEASLYRSTDGWVGVPSISFKNAACEACRYVEGMTMIEARGTLFVQPDGFTADGVGLVRIYGDGPHLREDLVRVGKGAADLRYRGYWRPGWNALVQVRYNENVISESQIANLLAIAGLHCGIGEGRPTSPSCTMDWGLWHVGQEAEMLQLQPKVA